jgi:hypothetical protein
MLFNAAMVNCVLQIYRVALNTANAALVHTASVAATL